MSDDARREQSAPSSSTAAPSSSTAASPAAGADARRQQLRKAQAARTTTPRRRGPMGRGPAQTMATEKPRDPKGSLLKLLRYLGGHRRAVVVVIIFAIASTLFMILGPKILGTATTELFSGIMAKIAGTGDGPDFSAIAQTLLFLCGLYLISALFQFVQGFLMTGVANKICYQLRRDLDEKIMRLPFSYYDKVATGDVMSRITNDVDAIQQCLNQSITQLITSVTTLLGILVMMLSISWAMTLIALVTLPLSAGIVMLIIRRSQRHFVAQQDYLGEVNGMVEENFATHTIVRAFNGERQALEQFSQSNNRLYTAAWRANFLSGLMMPVMNIISNLGYV
ncbi:MAG: ABC transporter ATP-binding protein, partial [Coriobacteriales bacterium]|nr:ABC transporter ATP-binding protein [Coriobacteriales bacterium]